METYTADHYGAIEQVVAEAIERSISHTELVRIECLTAETREAVERELFDACEGCADEADGARDFWGVREISEPEDWRVHVAMAQEAE